MFSTEVASPRNEPYRRDLQRIQRSRAFRRLANKTQVIHAPSSDHISTRLTHTLEVASIAKELAAAMPAASVDVDLVEAIALAHDVGHPPFGHAGEAVLARLAADEGLTGFHHASFGVRLLSRLERGGDGLAVVQSADVLAGVLAHSKGKSGPAFANHESMRKQRVEGLIVRAADLYAYAAGDIDDAFRLGVLRPTDLPSRVARTLGTRGETIRERLVAYTRPACAHGEVRLEPEADLALAELRALLYERFYEAAPTAAQTRLAQRALQRLWKAFSSELSRMLDAVGWQLRDAFDERPTMRDALDAIACMTDRFALACVSRC